MKIIKENSTSRPKTKIESKRLIEKDISIDNEINNLMAEAQEIFVKIVNALWDKCNKDL